MATDNKEANSVVLQTYEVFDAWYRIERYKELKAFNEAAEKNLAAGVPTTASDYAEILDRFYRDDIYDWFKLKQKQTAEAALAKVCTHSESKKRTNVRNSNSSPCKRKRQH